MRYKTHFTVPELPWRKNNMTAGRRTLYTEERINKICKALENGLSKYQAADVSGIEYNTLLKWIREKPEFALKVKVARAKYAEAAIPVIKKDARTVLKHLQMIYREDPDMEPLENRVKVTTVPGIVILDGEEED